MSKCKNVECTSETVNNNLYCSLKCRNYYVNKYIRDYSKNGRSLSEKAKINYLNNPKLCKHCSKPIDYDKSKTKSKYCSKECSKVNINKDRKVKKIKYKLTENGLKTLRDSAIKNLLKSSNKIHENALIKYNKTPTLCFTCNKPLTYKNRYKKFCCRDCNLINIRKNMPEFLIYKSKTKFNFSLNEFPDEFDFSLIEKYGWYSPSNSKKPNLGGVSRDHMLAVRDGFNKNINPNLLAHPANCRLMIHNENISKNKKSIITEEELINKINEWNAKYGRRNG